MYLPHCSSIQVEWTLLFRLAGKHRSLIYYDDKTPPINKILLSKSAVKYTFLKNVLYTIQPLYQTKIKRPYLTTVIGKRIMPLKIEKTKADLEIPKHKKFLRVIVTNNWQNWKLHEKPISHKFLRNFSAFSGPKLSLTKTSGEFTNSINRLCDKKALIKITLV